MEEMKSSYTIVMILSVLLFIAIIVLGCIVSINYAERKQPKAIDVYRNKTELIIITKTSEYGDTIKCDSIVRFK